jgi:hypothetical protein
MMKYQGQFRSDRATMIRIFGEPDHDNTFNLTIHGRKAIVYSKYGNTWTVEAESQRTFNRVITKIQIES